MADITEQKPYPEGYDPRAIDIIDTISFGNAVIVGSQSLRSQQYAGDYDLFETAPVEAASRKSAVAVVVHALQGIVQDLLTKSNIWIADFKAGIVPEWEIIPETAYVSDGVLHGFDPKKAEEAFERVAPYLTSEEYKEAKQALHSISVETFFAAKKLLRYHIVRWTPAEILAGSVVLRDFRTLTLAQAIQQPAIIKLDLVAYLDTFTDFSILYVFKWKGKVLNGEPPHNIERALEQDILALRSTDSFKALKRLFSLARYQDDVELLELLQPILNGDLGRLYSILSDANTLLWLLENKHFLPLDRIHEEIGAFRARLARIYTFLVPDHFFHTIVNMEDLASPALREQLEAFVSDISSLLHTETLKAIEGEDLLGSEESL